MRPTRSWFGRAPVLAALTLAAAGCGDDGEPCTKCPDPIEWPLLVSPVSAKAILYNLRLAYAEQNFSEYATLFSSDFAFAFSPTDVSGPNPTPDQWDQASELRAARRLFDEETVTNVSLTWRPGVPDSAADEYPTFPECQRIRVGDISLRVTTRPPDLDEPLIRVVDGAVHELYFREGRGVEAHTDPATGQPVWYCFLWKDLADSVGAPEESWGRIKYRFF